MTNSLSRKEGGKGLAKINYCIAATIYGFYECIQMSEKRLVPAANNNNINRIDLRKYNKTVNHIRECNKLSQKKYKSRYDCVGKDIYWKLCKATGLVGRVFANGQGERGSIPGQAIPKTQEWYLIPTCLTLRIIRYVSRANWFHPGKWVAPSSVS